MSPGKGLLQLWLSHLPNRCLPCRSANILDWLGEKRAGKQVSLAASCLLLHVIANCMRLHALDGVLQLIIEFLCLEQRFCRAGKQLADQGDC